MNKHLQQLIDLSIVDKDIDAFEPQIEEATHKFESAYAVKETIQNDITNLETEIKDEKVKKQKNELHLAELSQKLEDNSRKSAEIKSEREMKSLQLEEEIAKEQVTFANEEIARLEKLIENKEEKIEELKTSMVDIEANLTIVKAEVDEVIGSIDKDRQKVFEKKEKLVSAMNQKGLVFYQKIRRWAKDSTAVEVKNKACMGCYMAISDRVYSEVIKAEEITTCPHCGRILYLNPNEEEVSA